MIHKTNKLIIIPLFFILICSVKSNAQFLNKEAVWSIQSCTHAEGTRCNYHDIKIVKDSIVNGINYAIFKEYGDIFALREDSNRVYYKVLNPNFSEYDTLEHIIYDFNLLVGDSIRLNLPANGHYELFKWVVREVDSILIGADLKKRLLIEYPDGYAIYGYGMQHWIEDVGSTQGPLCFTGISEFEFSRGLCYYKIIGKVLYGTGCPYSKINDIQTDNNFSCLYDQNNKILKVSINKQKEFKLIVYSITGIKMCEQYGFHQSALKLNHLNAGVYIVVVKTNDGSFSKKIIIN